MIAAYVWLQQLSQMQMIWDAYDEQISMPLATPNSRISADRQRRSYTGPVNSGLTATHYHTHYLLMMMMRELHGACQFRPYSHTLA